ncbi:MAG: hypothetical protein QOF24_183 [Verrucomicrobiota bacterium]
MYTACWNDAKMLTFFFRHYDSLVQRYVIFDDGSTDESLAMLGAHPKVDLRQFPRTHPDSFVLSEQQLSNVCWQESCGRADWVFVIDLDEHLVHFDVRDYLTRCRKAGVTIVPALGFQMISREFPSADEYLCRTRTKGTPWSPMCKLSVFDPCAIDEINFSVGRHSAEPTGKVIAPHKDEMLNLHYKYLNFDRTAARHRELLRGLGSRDHAAGWAHKYRWSDAELREDWELMERQLVDVAAPEIAAPEYPLAPWWKSQPRAFVSVV